MKCINLITILLIATCCQTISISASNTAKSRIPEYLGQFNFVKTGSNGRPIYKNSRNKYLYLDADNDWAVSRKYQYTVIQIFYNKIIVYAMKIVLLTRLKVGIDYTTTSAKIYHPECSDKCPTSCSNNFKYSDGSKWQEDRFIRVSCSKTLNTL